MFWRSAFVTVSVKPIVYFLVAAVVANSAAAERPLLSTQGPSTNSGQEARPNVVLIMTDDQGYGDLGCHGNPVIKTPNLDKLHAESVRLTDFHVDPTCSPTRGALMSGKYSHRAKVWHTIAGGNHLRAPQSAHDSWPGVGGEV